MRKFAIYTALIGGYDQIQQPGVADDDFDFILFTDEVKESSVGVWQARNVSYRSEDKTRIARYVKTHPEELLPEYAATLWIDANIQITSHLIYERVRELFKTGIQIASVKHPWRDCIYDEAYQVYGLDYESVIFNWCHYLRSIDYPRNNGLFETGLLYRLYDDDIKSIDDLWWECISVYSRRDQLSFNFVLWRRGIMMASLLPEGEYAACSTNVQINRHQTAARNRGRRGVKETFWEHSRNRCRHAIQEKEESFREFHYWLYGLNPAIAKVLLHIWGVYVTIVYGIVIKSRANKRNGKDS